FLREIADGNAAFGGGLASIGGFLAEDDGEESGFAGAVGADQADAILAIDLEGHIREEDAVGVGFGYAGESEHLKSGEDSGKGMGEKTRNSKGRAPTS